LLDRTLPTCGLRRSSGQEQIGSGWVHQCPNVKKEGDHFDAKATDKSGKRMALDIDAKTGAIKPEEKNDKNERNEHR
jgi:hypothetical protein